MNPNYVKMTQIELNFDGEEPWQKDESFLARVHAKVSRKMRSELINETAQPCNVVAQPFNPFREWYKQAYTSGLL